MTNHSSRSGFSMIELLVAATILALLTVIAVVSFQAANQRARDGKRKADLEQVRAALELYRSDTVSGGSYPSGPNFSGMVSDLSTADYLSQPLPQDPKNDSSYFYQYTRSTSTTYCMCARMENTTGGNSADSACNFSTGGGYYCLVNP